MSASPRETGPDLVGHPGGGSATTPASTPPTTAPARIVALDVLRGFALTGIIFVNVEPVTRFSSGPATLDDPSGWLQLLVQQRFFPLFSLLFGISFALVFASARRRGVNPRAVLARRLLVLLPLGVVHQLLHPGEALTFYAVLGLLVLLPSTWLPRAVVAAGAAVALPASLWLFGGGLALVPGAFLLGSALVRYGVVERIEGSVRVLVALLATSVVVAVPALVQQLQDLRSSGFDTPSGVAGAAMATAYAAGLLLALRAAPLRRALVTVFAPLGRMALTNYVSATVVMVVARHPLHLQGSTSWATVLGLAGAIIVVQVAVSTRWLARHRYGPLERLWRWATWGRRSELAT